MKPSALYRSELWRIGLSAARVLPRFLLENTAVLLASSYHATQRRRRTIVTQNLLPPLAFDAAAARAQTRALFRQFGLKLADLWRYEAGCAIDDPIVDPDAWKHFDAGLTQKRGLLLVTPHIGNWELGAPFLRKKGIELQVITQAEPQGSLTELRKSSRSRWGIDTLVIGENPFGFVEVIRRLDAGAAVALLIDRPPPQTGVTINLFGRPFMASNAAAELARASGCAVLPACIPRAKSRYEIQMLPPVRYDRAALGTRAARIGFTQELMSQFEPMIRAHLDQWFHFVPVWPHATVAAAMPPS